MADEIIHRHVKKVGNGFLHINIWFCDMMLVFVDRLLAYVEFLCKGLLGESFFQSEFFLIVHGLRSLLLQVFDKFIVTRIKI